MGFKSDIEIAQECEMKPITEIAAKAGIDEKYLEQFGSFRNLRAGGCSGVFCLAPLYGYIIGESWIVLLAAHQRKCSKPDKQIF